MRLHLMLVPYDSGMRGTRMGAGPEQLVKAGLREALTRAGHSVTSELIELPSGFFAAEVQASFELNRRLASAVARAVSDRAFPLILSGNCSSALGTVAGLGGQDLGIAWFDAHGDFNTPETTTSGFFDGMALATATGRCWRQAVTTLPGFAAVPDDRVMHFGARDFDAEEESLLQAAGVERFPATRMREGIRESLEERRGTMKGLYLHVDLDVLDSGEGKANGYAIPGGLTAIELESAVRDIAAVLPLRAAAITAYDPAFDADGRIGEIAIALAASLAASLDDSFARGLD